MTSACARHDDGRFYPARDVEAALELRRLVWGPDHPHNDAAFYQWLASGDDFDAPQGVLLRRGDVEALGFASLCIKPFHVDGQTLKLAHGLDYMVRPGSTDLLQGRTALRVVSAWIALARARGCSFGITFPNEKSHRLLNSERAGFSPVFGPRLMIRPLSSARPDGRLHPRAPVWAGRMALRAGALASTALAAGRSRGAGSVEPVAAFGPEFDDLWRQAARQLKVAVIRDSRHLTWRYRCHPVYDYRGLSLRRRDGLAGYAVVVRRSVMNLDALLIVDLLVRDWDDSAGTQLVAAAVDNARAEQLDMVAALCIPGGGLHQTLRRSGFVPVPERVAPRIFRTAGIMLDPAAAAAASNAWHFTWGDTDVV